MNVMVPLNMAGNEIQNIVIQVLATAPATAKLGQIYYNSGSKSLYQYNGSAWKEVGTVYVLPQATTSVMGGIKLGDGLQTSNGVTYVSWDGIPNKPNTVDGYGIVDAVTEEEVNGIVSSAISALGTLFKLRGAVASYKDLPSSGQNQGDTYIVSDTGKEYVWVVKSGAGYWEELGTTVDLSGYLVTSAVKQTTGSSQTDVMSQAATTNALLAQKITTTSRHIEYDASSPDTDPGITVTVPGQILYVDVTDYNREQVLCDVSYSADRKTVTITAAAGSFREDRPLIVTIVHFAQ